ncbi:hypothetical protein PM8797T_00919 [Gimesia maris DSM 8797]|nr:hypothetical protein PM8797T_00919 [Gimesia maris DSM 8797]
MVHELENGFFDSLVLSSFLIEISQFKNKY